MPNYSAIAQVLCREDGGHQYATHECKHCGHEFCWGCAPNSTRHLPHFSEKFDVCPNCGENHYF